jgi:hypothetical protein
MARGWESKSVEEQLDAAAERRSVQKTAALSADELERKREIESLELSRTRVLHDLETVTHERYRATLQAALQHLETKIAELRRSSGAGS